MVSHRRTKEMMQPCLFHLHAISLVAVKGLFRWAADLSLSVAAAAAAMEVRGATVRRWGGVAKLATK